MIVNDSFLTQEPQSHVFDIFDFKIFFCQFKSNQNFRKHVLKILIKRKLFNNGLYKIWSYNMQMSQEYRNSFN